MVCPSGFTSTDIPNSNGTPGSTAYCINSAGAELNWLNGVNADLQRQNLKGFQQALPIYGVAAFCLVALQGNWKLLSIPVAAFGLFFEGMSGAL